MKLNTNISNGSQGDNEEIDDDEAGYPSKAEVKEEDDESNVDDEESNEHAIQ